MSNTVKPLQSSGAITVECRVSVRREMRTPRNGSAPLPVRVGFVYLIVSSPRGPVAYVDWGHGCKSTQVRVADLVRRDDWRQAEVARVESAIAHASALAGVGQ